MRSLGSERSEPLRARDGSSFAGARIGAHSAPILVFIKGEIEINLVRNKTYLSKVGKL